MEPKLKLWLLLFVIATALIFTQSASPGKAAGASLPVSADFSTIQAGIDTGKADFVGNREAVMDLPPADSLWVAPDSGYESILAGAPPPNFKVAFIGDQGSGSDATAVLQLIKDEGTDLVLHQGDFDYSDDPDAWDQKITDVLGASFPYFISIGNHDKGAWSGSDGYQAKFARRLALIPDARCTGDLGVNSTCIYKGLAFFLSGVGTQGSGHEAYIQEALAADDHIWRICSWHKNMNKMQVGDKEDQTGWGVYEACLAAGAIVATAHQHSYSRTYLMSSFENQVVADTSPTLVLDEGKSFAFVSGLGGRNIKSQVEDWPWMAAVHTSGQGANHGALFCTFNVNGMPDHADCYFKDIDGLVPDQFELISNLDASNSSDEDLDAPCDYTVTAPDSIQDAIDTAGVGEVVCLDDIGGAFTQSVVFSGEDEAFTTLTAVPGASPIIDGTSQGGKTTGITIDTSAHDVTIDSLKIMNFGHVGIRINGHHNNVIDVISNTNGKDGIRINGYQNKVIDVISNTNGKDGIRIDGNANKLTGVTTDNNVQSGIHLVGDDNEISYSSASGNDDGIESDEGSDRNKISHTNADNNINRGFHFDGADSSITYSTANRNGPRDHAEGITLHGGGNYVAYTTANGNFTNGINISKGHRNRIHDNTANDNLENGFYVSSDSNDIYNNTASDNLWNGIRVVKDNNNIHDNFFHDNGIAGVFLTGGASTNSLSGNAVSGNTYGIHVEGDDNVVGPDNLAKSNHLDGIRVTAKGSNNKVHHNIIIGNGAILGNGITVDGDTNSLSGNKVSGNTNGIEVTGDNTTITDNTITENLVNGVTVVAGSGTTINFNVIDGNVALGVSNTSGKEVVDAECNWWGARDGPGGTFGPGSGEGVSRDVDFSPWFGLDSGQYYMGTVSWTTAITRPETLTPSCALFNLGIFLANL